MPIVVETKNLEKIYMLGKIPVHALRGIDLRIRAGDFIAIVGPSGSGKSRLLNLVGALDKSTEGEALNLRSDMDVLSRSPIEVCAWMADCGY